MAGKVVTMTGYSTHQTALVKTALRAVKGDTIVELGCGYYSTPILAEIAKANGLNFIVYYSDKPWQENIEKIVEGVTFVFVPNWNNWVMEHEAFMVMLDNEELCVNRYKQINRSLYEHSQYIVVHDADIYPKRGINIRDEFEHEYYDDHIPHTMVITTSKTLKKKDVSVVEKPQENLKKSTKPSEKVEGLKNLKVAIACAYVAGGDYDNVWDEYIKRLAEGIKSNTTKDIDFYCATVMNLDEIDNVKQIVPLNNFKGWHIKAELFNPEHWEGYDRVLYVDLDTVITGNIDEMLENPAQLSFLRDFYHPATRETGMIWFDPSRTLTLYNRFVKMQPNVKKKDAKIIDTWAKQNIPEATCLQDMYSIGSYKVSLIRDKKPVDDYSIICFHGNPRPHHVNWSLDFDNKGEKISQKQCIKRLSNDKNPEPVEPIWEGEDCWILGGGPSIKGLNLSLLDDKKVLGVNDGYLFDCCDICYFGDTIWWKHHKEGIVEWGKPLFSTSSVHDPSINHLGVVTKGLTQAKDKLGWNQNSGFAAINLAIHLGAKRIYLVGYDMNFGTEGESNWHENIRKVAKNSYDVFLRNQKRVAEDAKNKFPEVQIINTNPDSRLSAFPKITFEESLGLDESLNSKIEE
jgi:lipopolysaccharide biosynthesis glycosyltransferase